MQMLKPTVPFLTLPAAQHWSAHLPECMSGTCLCGLVAKREPRPPTSPNHVGDIERNLEGI